MIMDSHKMEGGLFHLRNSVGYGLYDISHKITKRTTMITPCIFDEAKVT